MKNFAALKAQRFFALSFAGLSFIPVRRDGDAEMGAKRFCLRLEPERLYR